MTVLRRLAERVLHSAVRRSSAVSQCWGNAMLGELDFVENDWIALLWALGGTTALIRHSVQRELRKALEKRLEPDGRVTLKNLGKKIAGMLSGIVIASGVLTITVVTCVQLLPRVFPQSQLMHQPFVEWLTFIGMPETIFIVTAIAFWRRRRSMATGLLLAALIFITHVIIHVTTHG